MNIGTNKEIINSIVNVQSLFINLFSGTCGIRIIKRDSLIAEKKIILLFQNIFIQLEDCEILLITVESNINCNDNQLKNKTTINTG
jgi:hypothetical protein